jgi:hypothetical protein
MPADCTRSALPATDCTGSALSATDCARSALPATDCAGSALPDSYRAALHTVWTPVSHRLPAVSDGDRTALPNAV